MKDPRIEHLLRESDVFGEIDEALRAHLVSRFEPLEVADGVDFIREGDQGEALYLVLAGNYKVYVEGPEGEIVLHEGGAGDTVGDVGLLARERRSASVRAVGELELAELPRAVFELLDDDFPQAFEVLRLAIIHRLRHMRLEDILRVSGPFGNVDEETLKAIEDRLTWVSLTSGDRLMTQGEPGDAMYILVHGRLAAWVTHADGTRERVAEVRRGETVGEIALVTGRPRAGDVVAIRDSELARLDKDAFESLVHERPGFVVHNLAGSIVGRLTDYIRSPALHHRGLSALAVLPLHEGVDLAGFCRDLERAFGRLGSCQRIERAWVEEVFGEPSILESGVGGREILSGWLNGRELDTDHLLLQGEYGLTPWTQACLRQADQVLWVADAHAQHGVGSFHAAADELADRAEPLPESLALIHREGRIGGTTPWIDAHEWHRHHHVRPNNPGDVERIARFLTDRAVGLVFSGGAARGFAHAGVVRAMREAGVPIDCVAGVSMGAIMAALCAQERDAEDMVRTTLALTKNVMDRTLPMVSVVRGRRFIDALTREFGDALIEDLPLPSFYLSANLTQARVEVHDRGPVSLGVTASNAPPGLGPPVVFGGDLLVDGFVMNNLPVDRMRGFVHGGPIVAVDVMPATDLPDNADFGRRGLSGFRVLWHRINPFLPTMTLPSIAEIIMRSHEINSVAKQRELKGQTKFYLQPPVGNFEMFDYGVGRAIADASYQAVRGEVQTWAKELGALGG